MDFTRINDFIEYVLALFENVENHIIFISSSDAHTPQNCNKHKLELFKSLGIKSDLQKSFRYSFLAIIDSGKLKIEQCSKNEKLDIVYEFGNHRAKIISQGFNACSKSNSPVSINIDDYEYAVNRRGLNIVVWNLIEDCVVDSVVFDTFYDDTITRKKVNYDMEALCKCYKILCELSATNSSFSNYYCKKLSQNKLDAEKIYNHLSYSGVFLAKIQELVHKGISVFAFAQTNVKSLTNPTEWEKICCSNDENGFMKKDLDKYFKVSGMSKIYSREVFEDILKNPIHSVKVGNYYQTVNQTSQYVNVDSFGQRPTESFPTPPYKTIYIFGNSIGCTWEMADRHTLTNQLQELVKDRYRVINHCIAGLGLDNIGYRMLDIDFESGDIIVVIGSNNYYSSYVKNDLEQFGVSIVDLLPYFNAPHTDEIFLDKHHPNPNGYKIIAKVINDKLRESVNNQEISKFTNLFTNPRREHNAVIPKELDQWLKEISPLRPKIGSIVMNCNPFTLGHRYLIEQSAKKVDRLYIFVVEEDKSIFPFNDRIELVRKGTADLKNVTVLPSGRYIISSLTFTDYFEKAEHQDRVIDPSMDVELFGAYIAPALDITVRFAGEEPLDNITRQYNETMAKILPRYGISFEEILRKEENGEVISASRVRKLLKENDFDSISKIVPITTLEYLKSFKNNIEK